MISADLSLSTSATIGFSHCVQLPRGDVSRTWPMSPKMNSADLVGVHRLGGAVAEEVERGARREPAVLDRRGPLGGQVGLEDAVRVLAETAAISGCMSPSKSWIAAGR
jgi:hypothetical protein